MPVFSDTAIQISGVRTPSISRVTMDCFTGSSFSERTTSVQRSLKWLISPVEHSTSMVAARGGRVAQSDGRICRLAVDLLNYQSRFRQEAVDVHSTTYSGPFGTSRRDSLAARVGRASSALEP